MLVGRGVEVGTCRLSYKKKYPQALISASFQVGVNELGTTRLMSRESGILWDNIQRHCSMWEECKITW